MYPVNIINKLLTYYIMRDIPTFEVASSVLTVDELVRQVDAMSDKYGEIIFRFLDNEVERSILEKEFYETNYNIPSVLENFQSAIDNQRIFVAEARSRYDGRHPDKRAVLIPQSGSNLP